MRDNAIRDEAARRAGVVVQLAGLLREVDSPDFRRVALALDRIAVASIDVDHRVWRLVATVAVGCERTIGRDHKRLSLRRRRELWSALVWAVEFAALSLPHEIDSYAASLLDFYERLMRDQDFVLGARPDLERLISRLSLAGLVRLDALLARAGSPSLRDRVAARLRELGVEPLVAPANPPEAVKPRQPSPPAQLAGSERPSLALLPFATLPPNNPAPAERWLESRAIALIGQRDGASEALDEIALALGERRRQLRRLHEAIKFGLTEQPSIAKALRSRDDREWQAFQEFCELLQSRGMIRKYTYGVYDGIPVLYLHGLDPATQKNFFDGLWFERYIWLKARMIAAECGRNCSALLNYDIRLPNDIGVNLDVMLLVGARPFFIECKSGQIDNLSRYSTLRRALGLPDTQVMCVNLDVEPDEAQKLTRKHGVRVIDQARFFDELRAAFGPQRA